MIRIRRGKVFKILRSRKGYTEIVVLLDGKEEKAINYDEVTGPVSEGDLVVLNTTAVAKKLGTGGYHFVMANISREAYDPEEEGHIMKLRYTPGQVKCLSVEEEDSPYSKKIHDFQSLENIPVVVGSLHSQVPPAAAGIKKVGGGRLKVAYIMTDGAALPIAFSNLAAEMKEKGLIDATITVGHAFGGDYEAVNIYTGLIAAKEVVGADVIIAAMGPGVVGTGTRYGYTGIEQGEIINAVNILGGQAIAIPRISFAETRDRHRGISHHTVTALAKIALTSSIICIPEMEDEKKAYIETQMQQYGLLDRHKSVTLDGLPALQLLQEYGIKVTTMGRTIEEDREFFLAAGAAGIFAAQRVI